MPFFSTVVMPDTKDMDLSGLKDVILSPTPPIFPLAIGWWFLVLFFLILLIGFCFYVKYRYFPSPYIYTLRELDRIKDKKLSLVQTGVEISKLLKRVSIFKYGREGIANLSDKEWCLFLIEKGRGALSEKEADFIAQSSWMPPKKDIAFSLETLYTHTREWIKVVLKGK